jgi:hypothetical protein
MIRRRTALSAAASATAAATLAGLAPAAWAQPKKDSLVLAMTLEPPGLDPTAGAACRRSAGDWVRATSEAGGDGLRRGSPRDSGARDPWGSRLGHGASGGRAGPRDRADDQPRPRPRRAVARHGRPPRPSTRAPATRTRPAPGRGRSTRTPPPATSATAGPVPRLAPRVSAAGPHRSSSTWAPSRGSTARDSARRRRDCGGSLPPRPPRSTRSGSSHPHSSPRRTSAKMRARSPRSTGTSGRRPLR